MVPSGVDGFVVFCLLAVVVTVRNVHGTTLHPSPFLYVQERAGFLVYVVPDQPARSGGLEDVNQCALILGDNRYNLTNSDKVHTIGHDTRVQRFSADVCGIRVHNVRNSLDVHGLSEKIIPASDSRFKYHGNGLRTGECGMQIVQLEREDFGRWKCAIRIDGFDYTINVDVFEEVENSIMIVAICIAVTLVLGFVGGFIAYKKLDRRRVPYRNSVGSNSGLSMSSSINT